MPTLPVLPSLQILQKLPKLLELPFLPRLKKSCLRRLKSRVFLQKRDGFLGKNQEFLSKNLKVAYFFFSSQQVLLLQKSPKVQKMNFFGQIDEFFYEKSLKVFKSVHVAIFFRNAFQMILLLQKIFSALFLRFFWPNIRKHCTLEKVEKLLKKECLFKENNVFKFSKAFFTKVRRLEICQ